MGIYKTAKIAPRILDSTCIELAAITATAMIKRNPKANQTASVADWDRVVWNDEASAVVRNKFNSNYSGLMLYQTNND